MGHGILRRNNRITDNALLRIDLKPQEIALET